MDRTGPKIVSRLNVECHLSHDLADSESDLRSRPFDHERRNATLPVYLVSDGR